MSGRWVYTFLCQDCMNKVRIGTKTYCVPIRAGRGCIHADEGFVLSCDEYQPEQTSLFEEGGEDDEVDQDGEDRGAGGHHHHL